MLDETESRISLKRTFVNNIISYKTERKKIKYVTICNSDTQCTLYCIKFYNLSTYNTY